ncbi:hypothetical protein EH223_10585 [candidate division KSB1 bacterium]|nr:nucleotidyltransferase domain-containing protein [candidate division KSB1 bacterium]RQW03202.1 MAG: hypothetical protein EH223_10585 [candidate division KSB1 bacterium]
MAPHKKSLYATINIFLQDVKNLFKDEIISVVLFGSAARGDYIAKKSDINFLVVLNDQAMNRLAEVLVYIGKWTKRGISTPLFLSEHYITTSTDAFPIEFLSLKLHHKLLFGKDILSALEIADSYLRLKCEEQIKSKLLHLREDFLHTRGKKYMMRQLLIQTVPTLASIFSALIVLKKEIVPAGKEAIMMNTARLFGLKEAVFQQVLDLRAGSAKLSQKQLTSLLQSYIDELAKLTDVIDQW